MNRVKFLEDWYERVWVQQDLDAINEFFQPEALAEGLMSDIAVGPEDFAALVPALLRLVRDVKFTITHPVEQGDWLAALVIVEASSAETFDPVNSSGSVFMRFSGDKIVEAYNHFDFVSFFEALGLLPQDTVALCLSGESLG